MSSEKDPVIQGNGGREKTLISNQENHSICCHTEDLPGNKGLLNTSFSLRNLQGDPAQELRASGRRREHSTEACRRRGSHSFSQVAKKPRAKPKIRKLKLNKGIRAEPFPSKAASIWATLSIEDHQTEKCKWFWEIRQISWKRRKVPFESQIGVTARKTALHFRPALWDNACLRTFGVTPGKLSTKKKKIKSPPGYYYSIESSFWKCL